MLQSMRKGAASLIAKILLGLLVISFALWGVTDYVGVNSESNVLTVGDRSLSVAEFQREYRQALQRIESQTGQAIDPAQARELGLPQTVLEEMKTRLLFQQAADDQNLIVTDAGLRRVIAEAPPFRNAQGQFDRAAYEAFVRNIQMTPAAFEAQLREDMRWQQLLTKLPNALFAQGQLNVPKQAVDVAGRYALEQRRAKFFRVELPALSSIPNPSAEEIRAYYDANQPRFTAPETRAVRYALVTPLAFINDVQVTDDELREEYEALRANAAQPERRSLQQVVFTDEAAARAASASLKAGKSFEAMAQETRNLSPQDITIPNATRAQLPAEIAEAVFNLPQGGVSDPIQSPFGWHLVRVTNIVRSNFPTFEQAREEIRQGLLIRKASDRVEEKRTEIEDQLAGGATLDEVAQAHRLTLQAIPSVNALGNAPNGEPAPLPRARNIIQEIFSLPQGGEPLFLDAGNSNYVVLAVDSITPAKPQPLEAVQADIIASIKRDAALAAAESKAKAIEEKLKAGASFDAVAREEGASVYTSSLVSRNGREETRLPPAAVAALFNLDKVGAIGTAPTPGQGAIVMTLDRIEMPEMPADLRQRINQGYAAAMSNDFFDIYRQALEKRYGVTVNEAALEQAIAGAQ